jgi:hypothetical protein
MFVKQYVPHKIDDFSGSIISGRKLRYSFFVWYIGLTLETWKLTRIEYIAKLKSQLEMFLLIHPLYPIVL